MTGPETLDDSRNVRIREAFAAVAELAGDGAPCPPAENLWQSAHGELSGRANEDVILHLGQCTACAAAWRLARELGSEGRSRGRTRAAVATWPWFPWVSGLAAAAVLLAAAVVTFRTRIMPGEAPAEYRSASQDWIESLVPDAEPLSREQCILRWTSGPDGTTYDVRVTTEDLEPVSRGRGLEKAEFPLSEQSLSVLPSGGRIVWQVTAHLPDGGTSESRSFFSAVR